MAYELQFFVNGRIGVMCTTSERMAPFTFLNWDEFKLMSCINNFEVITDEQVYHRIQREIHGVQKSKWLDDDEDYSHAAIALMQSPHAQAIEDLKGENLSPQQLAILEKVWNQEEENDRDDEIYIEDEQYIDAENEDDVVSEAESEDEQDSDVESEIHSEDEDMYDVEEIIITKPVTIRFK